MKCTLRLLFLITYISCHALWASLDQPLGFYIESDGQNLSDQDFQTLIANIDCNEWDQNQILLIYKPLYLTPCELIQRIETHALSPSERVACENVRSYDSGILVFQGPQHTIHSIKQVLCLEDALTTTDLTSSRTHKSMSGLRCFMTHSFPNDTNGECILSNVKQMIHQFEIDDQRKENIDMLLDTAKILTSPHAFLFTYRCYLESDKEDLSLIYRTIETLLITKTCSDSDEKSQD